MKKIYLLIAISLFFLKLGYGNSFPSIIGGNNSTIDQQPWTVFLTSNINNTDRCGGAIIGSSWIVTAGHCVEGKNLNSLKCMQGFQL